MQHDDQRALDAADRAEREVVVAVDERRLDVEDRAHHGLAARAPRREPAADLGVVDGHAAAVAELVGDERDHRDRVDRGVEPGDARVRSRVATGVRAAARP